MKMRMITGLLLCIICVTLLFHAPVYARLALTTQDMTPHDDAMAGLRDFVKFLGANGLRTKGLNRTLERILLHEEGVQAAGIFLKESDEELLLTTRRTRYHNYLIFKQDKKFHLILRKETINALINRNFSLVGAEDSPVDAALRGMLHAFIASRRCLHAKRAEKIFLADTLTEHILDKVSIQIFAQNHLGEEARQHQSDLTSLISDALTENPQWERCYAGLGHLFVSVDFDIFPSGAPVVEGTTIEEQYLPQSVTFQIADTLLPPDQLIIDNATVEINKFFQGMSLPNVLTNRGFSPGSSGSLGCESDLKINFVDPTTRQPTTVSSASLRWIAGLASPPASPLPVRLIAKDRSGKVVARDTFRLQELFFAPASFSLRVFAKGHPRIASIETEGITGNGVCTAFDNLAFWPPRQ